VSLEVKPPLKVGATLITIKFSEISIDQHARQTDLLCIVVITTRASSCKLPQRASDTDHMRARTCNDDASARDSGGASSSASRRNAIVAANRLPNAGSAICDK
jgi:hypothetical protein